MKTKNNVTVKAKFVNEVDGNLDLNTLKVVILYSLPDTLGFTKLKKLEAVCIKNATLQDWIKHVNNNMNKNQVKSFVHSIVMEDIMKRLKQNLEKSEPAIISEVLNMINQLKFDFNFNMEDAESTIVNINKAFDKPSLPFGSVRGNYFNLNTKKGEV